MLKLKNISLGAVVLLLFAVGHHFFGPKEEVATTSASLTTSSAPSGLAPTPDRIKQIIRDAPEHYDPGSTGRQSEPTAAEQYIAKHGGAASYGGDQWCQTATLNDQSLVVYGYDPATLTQEKVKETFEPEFKITFHRDFIVVKAKQQ